MGKFRTAHILAAMLLFASTASALSFSPCGSARECEDYPDSEGEGNPDAEGADSDHNIPEGTGNVPVG